jgi:hypothetical protein
MVSPQGVVDIKCRNPCAAARPGDGELSGEGCLSGAAFALCDRDDQPTMRPAL